MIVDLQITGFKRFASCSLPMAPLTVLTGLNGAGKTTAIQALLLAREAATSSTKIVALNGPFGLQLGSTQDVLNLDTAVDQSKIVITVRFDDETSAEFRLDASDETLLHLPIVERPSRSPQALGGPHRAFVYLSAERYGPRDVLSASARASDDLGVGVQGEFCAQLLAVHGLKHKVVENRLHPERCADVDAFLKYQAEAWLSEIARPTEIDAIRFPNSTVSQLRFRSPGGEWVRAPNMGFGLSYSLPIVLGGLFAPERESLLLVENPEAHLHPAGQSAMGAFLARLAGAGVQVIVETHSDHVLNGIRRAIGESQVLSYDRAYVHFFDVDENDRPRVETLKFNAMGPL